MWIVVIPPTLLVLVMSRMSVFVIRTILGIITQRLVILPAAKKQIPMESTTDLMPASAYKDMAGMEQTVSLR